MKKSLKNIMMLCIASITLFSSVALANKGDFIILNGAEPQGLDLALISGNVEHRIAYSLFEGLVTTDPKTAKAIPGVAESWKISNDGKTYTFKLRKATWSDGVPITAQTFVDSWLRILDPKTAARYAWFPAMFIAGGEEYNSGKAGPEAVKIKAVADDIFELNLAGPFPYVLDALAHYSFGITPLHAIKKHGKDWTKPANFVGNGPFILETWEPQKQLTVVPSPTYWDKENVHLQRIVYIASDDNNTRYNMFINGEADWLAGGIPLDQLEETELRDDYHSGPYLATYYYIIQNQKKPFNDPKVRRALSMAISRIHIVQNITKAGQIPTYSIVPPMADYTPSEGEHENVEKAQALLAEAGFPNGKGFPEFSILYNTSEGHKKIAEYIQQQWTENLNLKVALKNQEWKTYLNTRRAGDFEVVRAGWIGDYRDPNTFLEMFVKDSAMNGGRYNNPEFDKLIQQAGTMEAGPKRMAILQKAEKLFIQEDQSVIPIYSYVTQNLIDTNKWGGWYENVMDWHPTKSIYLK